MRLLWFHAFSRSGVADIFDVLLRGPEPPTFRTRTKDNEDHLGIAPPRSYCYLGRTIDAFGDAALVFGSTSVPKGTMSPFDTGGLVKHIKPIDTWDQDARRKLLTTFSWPTAEMAVVLAEYPTSALAADYLDLNKVPNPPGPHAVWPSKVEASKVEASKVDAPKVEASKVEASKVDAPKVEDPKREANIWNDRNDWRAWTWEGRFDGLLPSALNVVRWTCPPTRYPEIRAHAESVSNADTQTMLTEMMSRYVHGGVGALVKTLVLEQLT
jgi:hypothetical protein